MKFLTSLPFVHVMEWVFIFLPLLYHALYGIYIWYRGDSNVGEYPWTGNWLYTSQRWTGIIAFAYILYHVIDMRFTGVHLMGGGYNSAFSKVWFDFQNPWVVAIYVIGIVAASWHFAYGVWLFAAKWGFTVGDRRAASLAMSVPDSLILVASACVAIRGFVLRPRPDQVPLSRRTTLQVLSSGGFAAIS